MIAMAHKNWIVIVCRGIESLGGMNSGRLMLTRLSRGFPDSLVDQLGIFIVQYKTKGESNTIFDHFAEKVCQYPYHYRRYHEILILLTENQIVVKY
jgi:hypothetical protein